MMPVSAVDGHMRAFSSEDGKVLWDFDTARKFPTVNGVKAHGGSIDGPGAVVVKGMVFINSGCPGNGGIPGRYHSYQSSGQAAKHYKTGRRASRLVLQDGLLHPLKRLRQPWSLERHWFAAANCPSTL
jgi:hypothetical protein